MAEETLSFDHLEQYLFLTNGNYLYKVPFRGGWAVLKVYYGSRSMGRYIRGTISNYLGGQTSFMPRARMLNEQKCLKIWRKAGLRVYNTYDDVRVKGLPEGGYMLFEYLSEVKFIDYFGDPKIPLDTRIDTWRRFLKEWHRRHMIAVELREPRLIHENGDMKHVMIVKDQFLYFDFEMTYRSPRRVEEFISREILAYLKSMGKTVGAELFPLFMEEAVEHYPDKALLWNAYKIMFEHPNPILYMARKLERNRFPGASKPFSKHNVARHLKKLLDKRST